MISIQEKRLWMKLWILFPVLLILVFMFNLSLGSVKVPVSEIIKILTGGTPEKETWENIVWQFRFPKAITAILAGSALAISGLQMQTFFRNPLAGPFVLGISSGASLGVALIIMASSMIGGILGAVLHSNWAIVMAATGGAAIILIFVVIVSLRIKDAMTILIIGLMFGSATGALVGILQFFSNAEEIKIYLLWTFGSLGGLGWPELKVFSLVFLGGILLTGLALKPLNAYLLGENYAQSMGIDLKKSRILIIIIASLFAGTTTAFCGPLAFIGIAVPHLTRLVIPTADHKILVPAVLFSGAVIMLLCDIISQIPGSENMLPINAVTSLFGAPVVIWIILRKKGFSRTFAA